MGHMEQNQPMPDLGSSLRAYRAAKGWNQSELAGRVGMSRQAISNLENSRSRPHPRTLERLRKTLGLPVWAMDGLKRKIVQPGPPFWIMPWPPNGITWEEVQIALVEYCERRIALLKQRAAESQRKGESFCEAVHREGKAYMRLREDADAASRTSKKTKGTARSRRKRRPK